MIKTKPACPRLPAESVDGSAPVRRPRRRLSLGRYPLFYRLLAGSLAVSLPVMLALSIGLSYLAAQQIGSDVSALEASNASGAAIRLTDWANERQRELNQVARGFTNEVDSAFIAAETSALGPVYPNFTVIEIVNPAGKVTGSTNAIGELGAAAADWFGTSLLKPTSQGIRTTDSGLSWIMTWPIIGSDDLSQGVVVGSIRISNLGLLLKQFDAGTAEETTEVYIVDSQRLLLYSSNWVGLTDAGVMRARGTLRLRDSSPAAAAVVKGGSGSLRVRDYQDHDVVAGFAPVKALGWGVISATDAGPALAAVGNQTRVAALLMIVGIILIAVFAFLFARMETRPIAALSRAAQEVAKGDLSLRVEPIGTREVHALGTAFNAMVSRLESVMADLGAAARELAATTGADGRSDEASASMEELARTSSSIASTIDLVAEQADETRSNLEQAQADFAASGERPRPDSEGR